MSDNKTYFIALLTKEKNRLIAKQEEILFRFWNGDRNTKQKFNKNNRYINLVKKRMEKIKTLEQLIENELKKN